MPYVKFQAIYGHIFLLGYWKEITISSINMNAIPAQAFANMYSGVVKFENMVIGSIAPYAFNVSI